MIAQAVLIEGADDVYVLDGYVNKITKLRRKTWLARSGIRSSVYEKDAAFETYEEACVALINRAEQVVASKEVELDKARERLRRLRKRFQLPEGVALDGIAGKAAGGVQ
ncbi:MAG TPA: hypothetical protein VNL17_14760 [Verrucomicrobiae bacterium]|nr:hypothetical protein [Verrucomicrobiae bacterium]